MASAGAVSPAATISPARQAAQYRLVFRRARGAAPAKRARARRRDCAPSIACPPRPVGGHGSRRGAGSSAKGDGTGTAPPPAFIRSSRRGRWSAPPPKKDGAAVRIGCAAPNTAGSAGAPRSHSFSSAPPVGRDSQNHNRRRAPGLRPCPAVACTTSSAPR